MEKTAEEITKSIAPCGLICALCPDNCKGCNFSEDSEIPCVCFQRKCCRSKDLRGCWECADFPCDKNMFDESTHGFRLKAFVQCAKEDGIEMLTKCIIRNEKMGIIYQRDHKNYIGDYDGLKSQEDVLKLLRTGKISG